MQHDIEVCSSPSLLFLLLHFASCPSNNIYLAFYVHGYAIHDPTCLYFYSFYPPPLPGVLMLWVGYPFGQQE